MNNTENTQESFNDRDILAATNFASIGNQIKHGGILIWDVNRWAVIKITPANKIIYERINGNVEDIYRKATVDESRIILQSIARLHSEYQKLTAELLLVIKNAS